MYTERAGQSELMVAVEGASLPWCHPYCHGTAARNHTVHQPGTLALSTPIVTVAHFR